MRRAGLLLAFFALPLPAGSAPVFPDIPSAREAWRHAHAESAGMVPAGPAIEAGPVGVPEDARPSLPRNAVLVPAVRQETEYSCGAAAMLSVLRHRLGFGGDEAALRVALRTSDAEGTDVEPILRLSRGLGLRAESREGMSLADLSAALGRGDTVLLDIQAWAEPKPPGFSWEDDWEDGHYVVLVGLDRSFAYFMDPWIGDYAYMPLPELMRRWHDKGTPKGKIDRRLGIVIGGGRPAASAPRPERPPVRLD